MKLRSLNKFISLIILTLSFSKIIAEEQIDIWNKEKKNSIEQSTTSSIDTIQTTPKTVEIEKINNNIEIKDGLPVSSNGPNIFGIYDPAENNFDLNMWSSTKAEDIRSSLKRIKKINLSKTSSEILENVLLSFSYPPPGMQDKEFVNLKINWLIDNERTDLIQNFLKQNEEFHGKSKAVQYLVDKSIAKANIKEGCENIKFIDSTVKDSYLEKFKIYCLVFDNKKSEAQLLLDLLREQKLSDNFFDDKINFLLGISNKTSEKINEKNLLNFYLSSVTIKDFKYQPSTKTKKEIWMYLNAANLIKLDDTNDKEKLKELEIAAEQGQISENIIFDIYKRIPFDLNTLINGKNLYQTYEESDARSLIYQKYLLSENVNSKLEYLFILEELFKKGKFKSIHTKFLSNELKKIGLANIPENYQEIAKNRILISEQLNLGKIKYNDKILHQSKIMKYYLENEGDKKIQKEIDKIFKKISKNRKYFYSAKDLALVDALIKDGFKIPSNFNYDELASKYEVPENLLALIKNEQKAFLALKIVEIIGEDEPNQLDPETIYFITNLLNEINLIKIRNKVITSALPLRV